MGLPKWSKSQWLGCRLWSAANVRPPPPNEEDYERHINQDTYDEGEFFQETRLAKKHFKNRSTSPLNIEVDNDSESEHEPEQEEPEQEEVTTADDLSMLDRLRK